MADGSAPIQPAAWVRVQRTRRDLLIADLWCGAGGTSTGLRRSALALGLRYQLVAVNHWPVAVETHSRMHPGQRHHCADLENARPRELVPEGYLDLLIASPTCTYHSRARGGRPIHDQMRMDPWHVVRWCTDLRVRRLLIENVPEFVDWGPVSLVTGRPIKARRGEYFRAWVAALQAVGFRVDYRVLNCADYGDATTRRRFFLIARSDRGPLRWPEPMHARGGTSDLLGTREPWRAARDIIDWTKPGKSIFNRPRPLKPNTIRRLLAGAIAECWPRPHIAALEALRDGRTPVLDVPVEQLGDLSPHMGLVMATASGGAARSVAEPVPTVVAGGNGARPHFLEPVIGAYYGGGSGLAAKGVSAPLDTVTTRARFGLAEPVVVSTSNSSTASVPRGTDLPLRTITTAKGGDMAIAAPAVLLRSAHGDSDGRDPGSRVGFPVITIIAAVSSNNVIGHLGEIPWSLKDDQAYFASVTKGGVLIMGRRTWEGMTRAGFINSSREVVALSSYPIWGAVRTCKSLTDALHVCETLNRGREIFICGGQRVYEEALPLADRMIISHVYGEFEGDRFFPHWLTDWDVNIVAYFHAYERNSHPFSIAHHYRSGKGESA